MLTESEEYSEPSRISKMEVFAKIVNSWNPLTISEKSFISDFRLGYEYASVGEAREPSKKIFSFYTYVSWFFHFLPKYFSHYHQMDQRPTCCSTITIRFRSRHYYRQLNNRQLIQLSLLKVQLNNLGTVKTW